MSGRRLAVAAAFLTLATVAPVSPAVSKTALTGLVDPTNPIVVTTTWDVSVWPVHPGADPGTSNGGKPRGLVHICIQKVDEEGEPVGEFFRLPWCDVPGIASPAPCIDGASRNAQMDISVRILMLSPDPQWRR